MDPDLIFQWIPVHIFILPVLSSLVIRYGPNKPWPLQFSIPLVGVWFAPTHQSLPVWTGFILLSQWALYFLWHFVHIRQHSILLYIVSYVDILVVLGTTKVWKKLSVVFRLFQFTKLKKNYSSSAELLKTESVNYFPVRQAFLLLLNSLKKKTQYFDLYLTRCHNKVTFKRNCLKEIVSKLCFKFLRYLCYSSWAAKLQTSYFPISLLFSPA